MILEPPVFYTHCRASDLYSKITNLVEDGWIIKLDSTFVNIRGEKFIRFAYACDAHYEKVAHIKEPTAMHKRVSELMTEKCPY